MISVWRYLHALASWVYISWAPCQTTDVRETNMRDHDLGNELKNGTHSSFPYMFPGQLV